MARKAALKQLAQLGIARLEHAAPRVLPRHIVEVLARSGGEELFCALLRRQIAQVLRRAHRVGARVHKHHHLGRVNA
jgi:hypothetical protein